jgi:hypothetical protein
MKTTFFILGLSVVLLEAARAQANQPGASAATTNTLPPDVLMTETGTVYNKFRVERRDPAGLIISYVPEGGGLGLEKVPFDILPEDWQKRYNYDPKKAAQFDLEQQQAMAFWREKMIAEEQANREKWARLAAEEEAAEQAKRDAEAAAAQGTNAPAIQTNDVLTIQATNAPAITDTNPPPPPPSPLPPSRRPGNL